MRSAQLIRLPYFFLIGQSRRRALSPAVRDPIRAGSVPSHADHETAVVSPVRRPPRLAVRHQRAQVLLERIRVELPDFFSVIEVRAQGVGLAVVLVKDVQVQRFGPPIHAGRAGGRVAAVHHRALPGGVRVVLVHRKLLSWGWARPSNQH